MTREERGEGSGENFADEMSSPAATRAFASFRFALPARSEFLLAVALKLGGAGASFVVTFVLARIVGATGTGHYALAIATITTVSQIALLGLDQIAVRTVGGDVREGAWGAARLAIRQVALWVSGASVLFAALIVLSTSLAPRVGLPEALVLPIAVAVLIFPLLRIAFAGLRAVNQVLLSQLFDGPLYSGLLAVLGITTWVFAWPLDADHFVLAYVAAISLSAALGWLTLFAIMRRWPQDRRIGDPVRPFAGWKIFLTVSAHVLTEWVVLAQLGAAGSGAEVGAFRAAYQIVLLLALVVITVENIEGPKFAGDFRQGDRLRARRRHRRAAFAMIAVGAVPITLCVVFAEPILRLFGEEFVAAVPALRIMALAQVVNIATGPVGALLIMAGRERTSLFLGLLSLAIAAGLGALLIPRLGPTGAAWAYAAALASRNLISYAVMQVTLRGEPADRPTGLVVGKEI